MPKEFFTERDIEDLYKRGVRLLRVNENIVLTELAFEKAQRLGVELVRERPVEPPSAPVRPYLSGGNISTNVPSTPIADTDLAIRIHDAVITRMGSKVDPLLLDLIIQRVLKSTGVK